MQLDLLNAPAKMAADSASDHSIPPVLSLDIKEPGQSTDDPDGGAPAREKSPDAFKTITEVAEELDVQQYVLRFWESKFAQIKPVKMRGGRRYYRPEDVQILVTIKNLLYKQGYTIKGAKKALSGKKAESDQPAVQDAPKKQSALNDKQLSQLEVIRRELVALRNELKPHVF